MLQRRHFLSLFALSAVIPPWQAFAGAVGDGLEGLAPGSPASVIYGFNHLAAMPDKARLIFDYRLEGDAEADPLSDEIVLDFSRAEETEEAQRGAFKVDVTMFAKTRKQTVPTLTASRVNPILLLFLQHDVTQMNRETGGSSHYFRNAIRRALNTPGSGEIHAMNVAVEGQSVPAELVAMLPFTTGADRQRMPAFAGKVYRFTVSHDHARHCNAGAGDHR